jgi:hypothetical protein
MQVLAAATLTKIKDIFSEESMTIYDSRFVRPVASCTSDGPTVSGVATPVSQKHASSSTMLKHLKSYVMPSPTEMLCGFSIAPAMQSIIIDRVPTIYPQLASVVRNNGKPVMACAVDSHLCCPAHSEVISAAEARPSATCVPIVDVMAPTSHIRSATIQIWATTSLAEVKGILHEEAMPICNAMASNSPATRSHSHPSIGCVRTSISEEHASMPTAFEHFNSYKAPPTNTSGSLPIPPSMTTIVVNHMPVVNIKHAPII